MRPKHCKGCKMYHDAGHKTGSKYGNSNYNSWCCKFGKPAKDAIGECKLAMERTNESK